MRLRDGSADRKAETRAARLAGAEWIKDTLDEFGWYPRAVIHHFDLQHGLAAGGRDIRGALETADDTQGASFDGALDQCLERITQQIEQDLLDLNAVKQNFGQVTRQFARHAHFGMPQIALEEAEHLVDEIVGLREFETNFAILYQGPQAPDDFTCAQGLLADLIESKANIACVVLGQRIRRNHQAQCRVGVIGDRGQRLIEFMCDTGSHFAHGGEATHLRDPLLSQCRSLGRASRVGDILARGEVTNELAFGVAHREAAPGDQSSLSLCGHNLMLEVPFFLRRSVCEGCQFREYEWPLVHRNGCVDPVATEQIHLASAEDVAAFAIDELHAAISRQRQQKDLRNLEIHVGPITFATNRRHRLAAQRDVMQQPDKSWRIGIGHLAHREKYRKDRTVFAPGINFATNADDVRHAGVEIALHVSIVRVTIGAGHQYVDVAPEQLVGDVTEQALAGTVEAFDMPPMVDEDHRIDRGIEQRLQVAPGIDIFVAVFHCEQTLARAAVGTSRYGGDPCRVPPCGMPQQILMQQILMVLAERAGGAQHALQKASVIARHLGARLELFACDAEHGWAVDQQHVDPVARRVLEECRSSSTRYLEALRGSIVAHDLSIGASVACANSLWEGLATRVREISPLLVVCGLGEQGGRGAPLVVGNDSIQLIRHATAPLLLTRGAAWAPAPRFVVAADFGAPDAATSADLRDLARRLCTHCRGWLAEPAGAPALDPVALIDDAVRMDSDILVLAAPAAGDWIRPDSPFERLLGRISCDLLVVPRRARVESVAA